MIPLDSFTIGYLMLDDSLAWKSATVPSGTAGVNWCWKAVSGGMLSCLKGAPRVAPRTLVNTRKHSHTLFRLLFFMWKNQTQKLENGSPGDPKIIKKTRKMRSGMECGKDWKKTLKNRSPGTLKIMVLLRRVAKKTTSTLLQKTQEMESKISSKSHKNP